MKLRVGLLGLGSAWQRRHAPLLRAMNDRFEVRAVCDQVSHRAEQAAAEFDACVVDGYRTLIERDDIDAILMLAPQWSGALPILAACEAGKAVYCAVALNMDIDAARQLKQRVEEAGIAFMAELPKRHAPATLRLKELIATQLGQPRLLFCHHRFPVDYDQEPTPASEGRPLHSLIELVDWCRFVVGCEPESVTGVAHPAKAGPYENDYEMFSLRFPGENGEAGSTAQVSCGHYLPTTWPEAITFRPPAALQVACEHGVAFVDLPASITWFDAAGRHRESLEHDRPVDEQLLIHFFRAVTSLVRRSSDLEDAYRSMAIVLAARESQSEACHKLLDL